MVHDPRVEVCLVYQDDPIVWFFEQLWWWSYRGDAGPGGEKQGPYLSRENATKAALAGEER